jgi:hypothetical protein
MQNNIVTYLVIGVVVYLIICNYSKSNTEGYADTSDSLLDSLSTDPRVSNIDRLRVSVLKNERDSLPDHDNSHENEDTVVGVDDMGDGRHDTPQSRHDHGSPGSNYYRPHMPTKWLDRQHRRNLRRWEREWILKYYPEVLGMQPNNLLPSGPPNQPTEPQKGDDMPVPVTTPTTIAEPVPVLIPEQVTNDLTQKYFLYALVFVLLAFVMYSSLATQSPIQPRYIPNQFSPTSSN